MMQITDSYIIQRNSLFNAMNRFIGAVNNMDQTVMVPSLLRDVPQEDAGEVKATVPSTDDTSDYYPDGDMYSSYVLLKSIRNDMEWGLLQGDERRREKVGVTRAEPQDGDDLEKQFRYHLSGLHSVLSKLTSKANTLTNRYKEEIDIRGCGN